MKPYILSLLIFLSTSVIAQEQYSRVRIWSPQEQSSTLQELGLPLDHAHPRGNAYLDLELSKNDIDLLDAAEINYSVLVQDLASYYQNQSSIRSASRMACGSVDSIPTPEHFNGGSMGGWLTYDELLLELDSMRMLYPNLISQKAPIDTFLTHENRPIYWLRISDNPDIDEPDEAEVLYSALHHAREVASLSTTVYFMWYLLENYDNDPKVKALVDHTEMYFVPVLNPDGYVYNETINPNGGGMWRKNRRDNLDGTFGVDLNRNYGMHWGFDDQGSSPLTSSETYRGPSAFSEPETQAMKAFCESHQFETALNYHSYGNLLIYPWGYIAGSLTPDSTTYINYASLLTQTNNYLAGTGDQTVGYLVNGDSDDWMYGEQVSKNKILAMTPEIGDAADGFWPNPALSPELAFENLSANLSLSALNLPLLYVEPHALPIVEGDSVYVVFDYALLSDTTSTFSVALSSTSSSIASIGNPITVVNPTTNTKSTDSILVVFSSTAQFEEINLELIIDQGLYQDTHLLKVLRVNETPAFVDNMSTMNFFGTSSDWGLDTNYFTSAPSSMADSPGRMYSNNMFSTLDFLMNINLDGASYCFITFDAKWAIEDNYDYVSFQAKENSGGIWTNLCGRYSEAGSSNQNLGQPLWDGTQAEWVTEFIDLSDYLGSAVDIRWLFFSDAFVRDEGFNFDNLKIYTDGFLNDLSTEDLSVSSPRVNLYPNPTSNRISLSSESLVREMQILDINGRVVMQSSKVFTSIELEVSHLPKGTYFVRLNHDNGYTSHRKFIVL